MGSEEKSKIVDDNVGFIGAGNMAKAIGQGLIKSSALRDPTQVYASAPSFTNLNEWKTLGCNVTVDNSHVVLNCEIVFLSVKPQYAEEAIGTAFKAYNECHFTATTLVSILAGTTIESIHEMVKKCVSRDSMKKINIVRAMPNTPLLVGEGCTVISVVEKMLDSKITAIFNRHLEAVQTIFSVNGFCQMVPENMINAIGALSGSGPAYVYQMIEALSDGGVKLGIPRDLSTKLAAQTFLGGGKMVLESGKHPGELKDEVCSPGGTTIAGIMAMEKQGIRHGLMSAIEAAYLRSEEIGKKTKETNAEID